MARPRKKHIQQSFEYRTHGGRRAGAGRPPKGKRSSEKHGKRDEIDPRYPLHLTTRVVEGLGSLRKRNIFEAIRAATITVFGREDFHLVHASIQKNHLHAIAEATNRKALSDGMQVFLAATARQINLALWRRTGVRRRGRVFADRYHDRPMKNPRVVRNTLAYVLNNWRRHGEDRAPFAAHWKVDPYSTGAYFAGWAERADSPTLYIPRRSYVGLLMWLPRTWLLRVGWKKCGTISIHEVPGRP